MDWKWTVTAVLPVVTLILGAWLNQINDQRREDAQLRREERLHTLEREREKRDRREEFELNNLTALLTAITELGAAAVRIRESRPAFGSEQMLRYEELNSKVNSLEGLVLNDQQRAAVERLHREITELVLSAHVRLDDRSRNEQILSLGRTHLAVTAVLTAQVREIHLGRT